MPIFRWLPSYKLSNLRGDLMAGLIVGALLIPQSLGYARIAGVPVEIGLYSVPLALVAYAVLGSSRQLIVGPASTVAIVSGSIVADITRDDPQDAVRVTAATLGSLPQPSTSGRWRDRESETKIWNVPEAPPSSSRAHG